MPSIFGGFCLLSVILLVTVCCVATNLECWHIFFNFQLVHTLSTILMLPILATPRLRVIKPRPIVVSHCLDFAEMAYDYGFLMLYW